MRKFLIIGSIVVVLLVACVSAYLVFTNEPNLNSDAGIDNPFDFLGPDAPQPMQDQLVIELENGGSVIVPDFTKRDQPAIAGPETGYQAGGAISGDYQILYFPEGAYFLVSLFSEPLGATRAEAEAELRQSLGLSEAQLCSLNAEVRTDNEVNETYAGRNLGLSFCPDSVVLP